MNLKSFRMILWALIALTVLLLFYMVFFYDVSKPNFVQQELGAPFQLEDTKGNQISDNDVKSTAHVMFFGFTHCPEVCPTTLFETTSWLNALGEDALKLKPYFITIDPERDTKEQLANYMQAFDPRITALTGSPQEINKLIKGYRIYVKKIPDEDSDGYNMDHTASVFLFNKGGEFQGTISYGENPDVAVDKLRKLVAKNAS